MPTPPLLPQGPVARRCGIIGCDGHPLNNVAVLNTLRQLGQDEAAVRTRIAQWTLT